MAPGPVRQYRLKDTTIAIVSENGKDLGIRVPANSTITVFDSLTESKIPNQEVQVQWIGKDLRMFAADILDRGEQV